MYFYQIDRINLTRKVNAHQHYITGRTLDVGAGENKRYAFPNSTEYVRMNTDLLQDGIEKTNVVGRAEAIPLPDGSFDSIVCTQVLIDVFEPLKAFREFSRVLKSGGKLLLTTSFLIDRQEDISGQLWHPTDHALRKLSEETGFKVLKLEGCGAFFSAMFQLVSRYLIRCYNLKNRRFARQISGIFARIGSFCIWLDKRVSPEMKKHYTDTWFLLAEKK